MISNSLRSRLPKTFRAPAKLRGCIGPALFVVLLGSAQGRAQVLSGPALQQVSKAVVRVDARGCPGGSRAATGFMVGSGEAVTAYHVIAGCSQVVVTFNNPAVVRSAALDRVLQRADLALLTVANSPPGVPSLPVGNPSYNTNDEVLALGYSFGTPSMRSAKLSYAFPSNRRLTDVVTERVRTEIRNVGMPALDLTIVNLDGHLVPGLSGAPILDGQGRVVAIGNSGIEQGAASISFAIPSALLASLRTSNDARGSAPGGLRSLYAAETELDVGPSISCGGASLVRARRRSLAELAQTSDDVLGLQQLLMSAGLSPSSALEFDIYQDTLSSAAFAVPAGATVGGSQTLCTADLGAGVEMRFRIADAASVADAQAQAVQFEGETMPMGAAQWMVDPSASYVMPSQRSSDGMRAMRKGVGRVSPFTGFNPPEEYVFEVFAHRGEHLLASSAINRNQRPFVTCRFNPEMPSCAQILQQTGPAWTQAVLAIHLTTFPSQ